MRLAASHAVVDRLQRALTQQRAADAQIEQLEAVSEMFELLRAKGLGNQAAMKHAVRMVAGEEPRVEHRRFADLHGITSSNA